jgi:uncharacterized membrane-anchored protein YhcB (DUF1043 family)
MMRMVGHVLLWLGFLSASFWSVSRLEVSEAKWSTIPWHWYALSMLVGIAGAVLLQIARRQTRTDESRTLAEFSVLQKSLQQLNDVVSQLAAAESRRPAEVLRVIDQQCTKPFHEFAEARMALVRRFGLQKYAEIMTQFASAERYVNRSWSAAADGYVDEVDASIRRAAQHLQETQRLLNLAESV